MQNCQIRIHCINIFVTQFTKNIIFPNIHMLYHGCMPCKSLHWAQWCQRINTHDDFLFSLPTGLRCNCSIPAPNTRSPGALNIEHPEEGASERNRKWDTRAASRDYQVHTTMAAHLLSHFLSPKQCQVLFIEKNLRAISRKNCFLLRKLSRFLYFWWFWTDV